MSSKRKFPIPAGFTWSHNDNCYVNDRGNCWNPELNLIYNPRLFNPDGTSITEGSPAVAPDPRQIEGGGPRIRPADVEAAIKTETFIVDGTLTICILTLQNGFRVTGESACADPANFDAAKGRELARKAASEKIWPLLGYALRDHLHNQGG
jgi:hypothetical protein